MTIWSQKTAYFQLEKFLWVHDQWLPYCNACKMAVSISIRNMGWKWIEKMQETFKASLKIPCHQILFKLQSFFFLWNKKNLFSLSEKCHRIFQQLCWWPPIKLWWLYCINWCHCLDKERALFIGPNTAFFLSLHAINLVCNNFKLEPSYHWGRKYDEKE